MKQQLLLAMALINQPKLMILDEPLNGLDPTSAIKVRELLLELAEQGTAILLSSHNLAEIDKVT
ncbi:AAA family ATPase [Peribacillus sp. TH16]